MEEAGVGMDLQQGDVAFRCNFATRGDNNIVISGPGVRQDKVEHYDEISCAEGAINRIKGREFVWTLLDYLEVVPKQGN